MHTFYMLFRGSEEKPEFFTGYNLATNDVDLVAEFSGKTVSLYRSLYAATQNAQHIQEKYGIAVKIMKFDQSNIDWAVWPSNIPPTPQDKQSGIDS